MGRSAGRRVVVAGHGMAGARFVRRLAAWDPDARIAVYDTETRPGYNRLLLTGVLAGRHRPRDITTPAPPGVDVHAGVRLVAVNRNTRTVVASDGTERPYDTLVLATGSRPNHPWRLGSAGDGRPLHTLTDCLRLGEDTAAARTTVVVGGGLLGVETALTLAARGQDVTLVHRGRHLMDRRLDAAAGAMLRAVLRDRGVTVRTGAAACAPLAEPGVTGVLLDDSSSVTADTTVIACGVTPRVGLARAAGLAVNSGVIVDDALRSVTDPCVHAIGACAEHRGVVHDTALPAWEQADVLAARLSGRDRGATYRDTRVLTRLALAPVDLAVFGETRTDAPPARGTAVAARPDTDVLCLSDAVRRVYKKVVIRGNRVVGGILLGDLSTVDVVRRAYEGAAPLPRDRVHLVSAAGGAP
jgi:assimilatory nitrate reductase electron transfer subunit